MAAVKDKKPEVKEEKPKEEKLEKPKEEKKVEEKKPKKGGKKEKPEKKNKMRRWKLYEISGEKAKKKNKSCPKCGFGVFLAQHKGRVSCGTCGYTESSVVKG